MTSQAWRLILISAVLAAVGAFAGVPGCSASGTEDGGQTDTGTTTGADAAGGPDAAAGPDAGPDGGLPVDAGCTPVATKLAFTTAAQTVAVNACSAVATVQAQDSCNGAKNVAAATSVSLSTVPPNQLTFYSDAACTTAVSSVTIAAGASSASFYFKGTQPGTPTINALAAGLGPAMQQETIQCAAGQKTCGTTCIPQTQCCDPVSGCQNYADFTAGGANRAIAFGGVTPGLAYDPKCMRIRQGQSVTFNGDFAFHPLNQYCGAAATISSTTSGTTASFTFSTVGKYGYHCTVHGPSGDGTGMAGAIEVVP